MAPGRRARQAHGCLLLLLGARQAAAPLACPFNGTRPLISPPLDEARWQRIARNVVRASLELPAIEDNRLSAAVLRWRFPAEQGATAQVGMSSMGERAPPKLTRPIFSQAVAMSRARGPAIVTGASDAGYALRWYPMLANKVLFCRAADCALYVWTGPLPRELRAAPLACACTPREKLLNRQREPSNHHVKITAMLLALDDVQVSAAIWVDFDSAFSRLLPPGGLAHRLPHRASVLFALMADPKQRRARPWFVCGCQLSARDHAAARRFLRLWLDKRCGHKDQPSAWDAIVQTLVEEGCYSGRHARELESMFTRGSYWQVRHEPPDLSREVRISKECLRTAPVQLLDDAERPLSLFCNLDMLLKRGRPRSPCVVVHLDSHSKAPLVQRPPLPAARWFDEQLRLLGQITAHNDSLARAARAYRNELKRPFQPMGEVRPLSARAAARLELDALRRAGKAGPAAGLVRGRGAPAAAEARGRLAVAAAGVNEIK